MRLPDGFRRTTPPELSGGGSGVEEEIRFHIESRVDELVASGVPEAEARRRAEREFGDRAHMVRRTERESRGGGETTMRVMRWMGEAGRDVRLAMRQVRRNPGLWAAAVVTLALGVGGTTSVYSVVQGVLLRALPYPDEERVVRIWPAAPDDVDGGRQSWSVPDLDDWRERSESLAAIGGYTASLGGMVVPTEAGVPEEVRAAYVTGGFFDALGTAPLLGGTLPSEAEESDPRVVVLSRGFWERRFGGDPDVVGRVLDAQHGAYRIVGVMPDGFAFPDPDTELWTFLANVEQESVPWLLRQVRVFDAVARIAPRTDAAEDDLATAEQELAEVARGIAADLPETNAGITSVELMPIRTALVGDVRTPLLIVLAAVALTLLIACANVANLLLARGAGRQREFAVRASLGAGRGRLVRQVLTEGLLLGVLGGVAGMLLATVAVPALLSRAGALIPRSQAVTVDAGVLLVALAVSVGTGCWSGFCPRCGWAGDRLGRLAVAAATASRRGDCSTGWCSRRWGWRSCSSWRAGCSCGASSSCGPSIRASSRRVCSWRTWSCPVTRTPKTTSASGTVSWSDSRPFPACSERRRPRSSRPAAWASSGRGASGASPNRSPARPVRPRLSTSTGTSSRSCGSRSCVGRCRVPIPSCH